MTKQTWTTSFSFAEPFITAKMVGETTKRATLFQKLRLLFIRSKYSFNNTDDGLYVVRYKTMKNTVYIMKRGTGVRKKS